MAKAMRDKYTLQIPIPGELNRLARIKAAKEGTTVTAFVRGELAFWAGNELFGEYLRKRGDSGGETQAKEDT